MKRLNLTGRRFERLLVVAYSTTGKGHRAFWECLCDCGKSHIASRSHLIAGGVKSCGCLNAERRLEKRRHGHTCGGRSTPIYHVWASMISRCQNHEHKKYHNYGGRGISVCERWQTFELFLNDMGPKPPGMSLDRKNNALGYFKENCRWATMIEQGRNRRDNRLFTINGVTKCMTEWAQLAGVPKTTVASRLKRGWPIERAVDWMPAKGEPAWKVFETLPNVVKLPNQAA